MARFLITVLGLFLIIFTGCENIAPNKFKLSGMIDAKLCSDSSIVYLEDECQGTLLDSTMLLGGEFMFEGDTISSKYLSISVMTIDGQKLASNFIPEGGGVIRMELGNKRLLSGTPLNNELGDFYKKVDNLEDDYINDYKANKDDNVKVNELVAEFSKSRDEITNYYCENNINNAIAHIIIMNNRNTIHIDSLKSFVKRVPAAKEFIAIKDILIQDSISNIKPKGMYLGCRIFDFKAVDESGNEVMLTDYIDPELPTLIYYWMPDCELLGYESPFVEKIFKKYQGKNLNVLGVGVCDDIQRAKRVSKINNFTWTKIFVKKSDMPADYQMKRFSRLLLVNPHHTVVALNLRGDGALKDFDKMFTK